MIPQLAARCSIRHYSSGMQTACALLGIDWGTSNRRAWWLAADGQVLAGHDDAQGLLASQGRFAEALAELQAAGPGPAARIVMSGMVGSASGWLEAPYIDSRTPLSELPQRLVPVPAAGPNVHIVPGLRHDGADGSVDVMRGEETQLLGALGLGHGDGWYVLPGTHSKWVRVDGGCVTELATHMTGELFALLTQHGTLASITREDADADADAATGPAHATGPAFERGVAAAGRSALAHALFGCRAQVVAGRRPAAQAREYLSGLLIGAEWHDVQRRAGGMPRHVRLIGSAALVPRYAHAARLFGCELRPLDARAVQIAALQRLGGLNEENS